MGVLEANSTLEGNESGCGGRSYGCVQADTWSPWVEVGVPIICVSTFVLVLIITYWIPNRPDDDDHVKDALLETGARKKGAQYTDEKGREMVELRAPERSDPAVAGTSVNTPDWPHHSPGWLYRQTCGKWIRPWLQAATELITHLYTT